MATEKRIPCRDNPQYREAIILHALRDFHERGIKGVTMSQISEEMHISKRTLYEVYRSKEALLMDCLQRKTEDNRMQMVQLVDGAPNVLEGILRIFRLKLDESHHINPLFLKELKLYDVARDYFAEHHEKQREAAVKFLNQGIEEGVFRDDADFEIIYDILALMIDNIFTIGLIEKKGMEYIFSQTLLCYLRGCTTEEGLRIINNWLKEQQNQNT